MELLPFYFLFAAVVMVVTCAPNGEIVGDVVDDGDFNELIRVCAKELHKNEDDILNSMIMPLESPGNCAVECLWRKLELTNPTTGKINKVMLMVNIRPMLEEIPSISKISEDTFYNCMDEGNAFNDKCEVVSGFFKCLMRDLFNLEVIKKDK